VKVAILIPTMNRPDFIERVMGYYNSLNSPHPIYIGDASNTEIATRISNSLKRFKNVEVKYFHWEGLDTLRTIVKLAEYANVENQFCAFSGDDDYFIPSSLTLCSQFLSENMEYRTVQGRAAIFALDCPEAYGKIDRMGQYWGINSLEQENGLGRLKSFSKNYFVSQFSTHRIDEFLADSELYREIIDYSLSELLQCFTFAIKGKSKFLECLYMVRSHYIVPDGKLKNSSPNFVDWVMQPIWSSECNKIIDGLSQTLCETDGLPLSLSRKLVTEALKDQFKKHAMKNPVTCKNASLLSRVKQGLPDALGNMLRKLKYLTIDPDNMILLGSKASSFNKDFLPVEKSLGGTPLFITNQDS
jgi:glycosyltransferase domain-containing protein